MALSFLPANVKEAAPQMLQYLIGSPVSVAAITAIILNYVLNREQAPQTAAQPTASSNSESF